MSLQIKNNTSKTERMSKAIQDVQDEKMCKLTLNVTRSLRSQLKIKAELNNTDMTEVVVSYIKKYIQQ